MHTQYPYNWLQMTPEQKREWRLARFLNPPGVKFISPEAEKAYHIRAQRLVDVYNVREPDRVPLSCRRISLHRLRVNIIPPSMILKRHPGLPGIQCQIFRELEYLPPLIGPGESLRVTRL
jgi:hypothetical protein